MSYETDNLKREIDTLKWQKADNHQLDTLNNKIYNLSEKIQDAYNKISYLEERISKLEQKELERENV
jgi:hypothetical protein